EPLEIALEDFTARVKARRAPVKAVLLNQAVVRGVGNIYADEALFRAGVHPKRIAASLKKDRIERLYRAMREVLTEAIESRGSSVSNYVDADGRKGSFQLSHRVYRRTGEPCVQCGATIRRTVLAQRGTHYCPKCQR
ncbi:MAG TPA: zinc finger domain-containing protein, partial [Bryobacteraceae bacterium]|nr:zinc finger domain-containing protein [Bryobacteraceae bacterium]